MSKTRNEKCGCSKCECKNNSESLLNDFRRFHEKRAKHEKKIAVLETKEQAIINFLIKGEDNESLEKIKKEYPTFSLRIDAALGKGPSTPPSLGCC